MHLEYTWCSLCSLCIWLVQLRQSLQWKAAAPVGGEGGGDQGFSCMEPAWVCPSRVARFHQAVGHASSAPRASLPFTETTSAIFKPYFCSRKAGFILNWGSLEVTWGSQRKASKQADPEAAASQLPARAVCAASQLKRQARLYNSSRQVVIITTLLRDFID